MPEDPLLTAKKEEAAKAMSSGLFKAIPIPPAPSPASQISTPDINSSNLIKPVPQKNPQDSIKIAEMRLQAQIAMEGDERRKKREEAARKERETIELAKMEEERKRKEQFERERIEKEKAEQTEKIRLNREKISQELKKQVEEVKENTAGLTTIRTLKADQENLIKTQNLSLVGIAIKEEERRRQRQENSSLSSGKNLTVIAISLVLILLGTGIGTYIYFFYYSATPIGILPGRNSVVLPSLIFSDTTKTLNVTNITSDDLSNRIKNEVRNPPDLRLGAVENYVFTKKGTNGLSTPINSNDFFNIIGATPPDGFLRTLGPGYMFGILSSAENAGFIVVKTDTYDKAWAGLLEWDSKTMAQDLYQTLTSLKPDPALYAKPFEDLLVKNIDTRILKDAEGTIRIVYGILDDSKTIIIAGSRPAFTEALNRFNTPTPISQ